MTWKWFDIDQNTDEWMHLRLGRVGGSEISSLMANYGKAFGDPAHRLALRVALEQITGVKQESGYTNAHMERGHEQEPIAKKHYEDAYFCEITNGGYYIEGDDIGVSPDGHIYHDGLAEVKSVIAATQFQTVKRGSYDPSYKWQLAEELKVSRKEWVDYISYCSEFPEGKRLFVVRVFAKDLTDEFKMIDTRFDEFRRLVDDKKKIIMAIAA